MKTNKLEINRKEWLEFLNLLSFKNELENKELLLQVKNDSLHARAVSPNKILCSDGFIMDSFEFTEDLGLDNISLFRNFLNSAISDSVNFERKDNKITITDNKVKLSMILRNPKYIINQVQDDKFLPLVKNAGGNEFTLKSENIKKIISFCNTISPTELVFSAKNKLLKVNMANLDNELDISIDLDKEVQSFSVKVSKLFIELLQTISNYDVEISMKDANPVLIRLKTSKINFQYLFAPLKTKNNKNEEEENTNSTNNS